MKWICSRKNNKCGDALNEAIEDRCMHCPYGMPNPPPECSHSTCETRDWFTLVNKTKGVKK